MPLSSTLSNVNSKAIIRTLLLAGVYYATARVGLLLAFGYKNVSAVWPPSGVALAILLLCGRSAWPAVFLGAFLANFSTELPIGTSLLISGGNTLEALAGARILQGIDVTNTPLQRIRDVYWLLAAAAASATVAATVGVASLRLGEFVAWHEFAPAWLTWWLGDAMGVVIITPPILTVKAFLRAPSWDRRAVSFRTATEIVLITTSLIVATILVFAWGRAYPYAVFPFLIWTAVRFGARGASLAVFAVSCLSVVSTLKGQGPFFRGSPELSLINLQAFMAVVSATSLVLAAAISERKRAEEEIAALNRRLQLAMAETHHRVKNNLQVIAAMVDLQVLQDKKFLPVTEVRRLGSHVRTLAMVHDILTQQAKEHGTAQSVSAKAILEKLLPLIQQTAGGRQIRYEVDDAALTTRQGTSLALVANEIISNAVKHGSGPIQVAFKASKESANLSVCDEGVGFPQGFTVEGKETTGLALVENLVQWDLAGTVRYENFPSGGARVFVAIPLVSKPEE